MLRTSPFATIPVDVTARELLDTIDAVLCVCVTLPFPVLITIAPTLLTLPSTLAPPELTVIVLPDAMDPVVAWAIAPVPASIHIAAALRNEPVVVSDDVCKFIQS